jgi:FkbH-like protein
MAWMSEHSTLVDLVRQRARRRPDRLAFTFLPDGETESAHLTYADLDRQARAIGAELQAVGKRGDRVLLLYPASLDYIAAFLGCLYAGMIAVPSYPPRLNRPDSRLQAIVADARATVALTSAPILSSLEGRLSHMPSLDALRWFATEDISLDLAEEWRASEISAHTLAFLQYTSGSTAAPKGVMVGHDNLLYNLEMLKTGFGRSERDVFISWLPLFHDMGLIVMALQSIYVGARCVLIPSAGFLQRPFCWLQALSRYKGTISGGPNFAYDLCVQRVTQEEKETLDLRAWDLAVNGAEPVRHRTLERFAKAFAPCGLRRETLYPGYGLAEATVFVSGGDGAALESPVAHTFQEDALGRGQVSLASGPEGGQTLVACGQAWLDERITIVDPESLVRCQADRVGEIWVEGPNVAQGYWNRPDETRRTFQAYLADTGEGPFLRTGDLGFVYDGRLYIAGRIKDLIIIRGRNHYPQDIELTVAKSHPALELDCGAAFSVDVKDEERLVVVQEVKRRYRHGDMTQVIDAVRQAVAEEYDLQVYAIVLIRPGSLPKTSSGKIQRRACRTKFLEGSLKVVASDVLDDEYVTGEREQESLSCEALLAEPTKVRQATLEKHLRRMVARILRTAPTQLSLERPLVALGLDSLMAAELQHDLEADLGVVVPAVDLLAGLSVIQLAPLALRQIEGAAASQGKVRGNTALPRIEPVSRTDDLPLSFEQERLWLLERVLAPGNPAYHIAVAIRITGELDVTALEWSLNQSVRRHQILRTAFPSVDGGQPTQVIAADSALRLPVVDLGMFPAVERDLVLRQSITTEVQRPFDLDRAPLLRALLFRLDEEEHVMVLTMHHLVSDAWSANVLLRGLSRLYQAFFDGAVFSLPALPVQYADFAHWQRQWMQGQVLEASLAYWREKLTGVSDDPLLPTDRPRPNVQSFRGAHRFFDLPSDFVDSLWELSRREGVTPFVTLLTAFKVALYHHTGREDICVGSPTAGRTHPETNDLIGFFAYPLVLCTDLSGDPSFRDLLARVYETALGAYAHQNVPFAWVVKAVHRGRRTPYPPVIQVMFSLARSPLEGVQIPGLQLDLVDVENKATDFDLFVTLVERERGLHVAVVYNSDLFEASTIENLMDSFCQVLEKALAAPQVRVSELAPLEYGEDDLNRRECTIAVAATFTAEPVEDTLAYWMQEIGLPARIEFAPYNQVFQQLLGSTSLFARNEHGVNVILMCPEDWQRFGGSPGAGEEGALPYNRDVIERNARDLVRALETMAGRLKVPCVVCLCPAPPATYADVKRADFFRRVESWIASEVGAIGGVVVVTSAELAALYPVQNYYDPYGDKVGHMPYTETFFAALGTMVARKIDAVQRPPYKVIVLDCDHTLWDGVCGEDGALGVKIDESRRRLQEFMIAQHDAGMLLCLCSKNNEADVWQVFERHPEMVLERDHFVSWRINWKPKPENLKALSEELQLGLDSFIFIDDSPLECARVRAGCPQVLSLQLPQETDKIPSFLNHVWAFDHVKVTKEDRKRTALYRQNVERERFRREALTFEDFMAGLELEVCISEMSSEHLERVAQLTQRTNQFNVTTVRRTESEIREAVRSGTTFLVAEVRDRFGDYGLVGVMAHEVRAGGLWVDTFLLSCRALGRGVEHRMLARLGEAALDTGLEFLVVPYLPTAKNEPAFNFLSGIGAAYQESTSGGYLFRFPAEVAAATCESLVSSDVAGEELR